ncbi:MAG: hypothetical protein LQ343_003054 [Gyalolechia ehrenbergii]|nr:MAG: hypothetical protein LQ343_003054 [Gyalolechia ehrenbergii]
MVRGGQASLPGDDKKEKNGKLCRPDWAAVRRLHDVNMPLHTQTTIEPRTMIKPRSALPGDTKISSKWKSSQIIDGELKTRPKGDWYKPIHQVYGHCKRARARYGYIITDEELVVMRFDSEHSGVSSIEICQSRQKRITLSFKAIPWQNQGGTTVADGKTMMVNLALWLLHLTAAHDGEHSVDHAKYDAPDDPNRDQDQTGTALTKIQ